MLRSVIVVSNQFHIVTDWYRKDCCPAEDLCLGISHLFLYLVSRSCTIALVTEISRCQSLYTFKRESANSICQHIELSQFKSLRTDVLRSNFLEPVTTLAAKLWTLRSVQTFFYDVLGHEGENQNNRLNTSALIIFLEDSV